MTATLREKRLAAQKEIESLNNDSLLARLLELTRDCGNDGQIGSPWYKQAWQDAKMVEGELRRRLRDIGFLPKGTS